MRMPLKTVVCVLAVCVMALSLAIPPADAATKLPKELLVFASTDSVTTWDPSASYSVELTYMANVYEPLIWVSPPGSDQQFEPALAELDRLNGEPSFPSRLVGDDLHIGVSGDGDHGLTLDRHAGHWNHPDR